MINFQNLRINKKDKNIKQSTNSIETIEIGANNGENKNKIQILSSQEQMILGKQNPPGLSTYDVNVVTAEHMCWHDYLRGKNKFLWG